MTRFSPMEPLTSVDLFCGAEGFRQAAEGGIYL
jgi:site-specific DNA-cytosine methylase